MNLRTIVKFWKLPGKQRALYLKALLAVTSTRLSLGLLPFERARQLLRWLGGHANRRALEPIEIEQISNSVTFMSAFVPGAATCLVRALATQLLLRRQGIVTELRVGFARETSGKLAGHAWLTYQGRIVIGDSGDLSRFNVVRFGSESRIT